MLSFGIPSSSSVYVLFFFFEGPGADFVFCCFAALEIEVRCLFLELDPLEFGFWSRLLFPLAAPDLTFVGAILGRVCILLL